MVHQKKKKKSAQIQIHLDIFFKTGTTKSSNLSYNAQQIHKLWPIIVLPHFENLLFYLLHFGSDYQTIDINF